MRFDSQVRFSCQGVTSILPVLREGVLTGSPEQKEEAAKALGLVIRLTSADALRPSVVNITGPLIRILGDRFSWNVKAALLETLSLLLAKVRTDRFTWSTWILEPRSVHRRPAPGVLCRQGRGSEDLGLQTHHTWSRPGPPLGRCVARMTSEGRATSEPAPSLVC